MHTLATNAFHLVLLSCFSTTAPTNCLAHDICNTMRFISLRKCAFCISLSFLLRFLIRFHSLFYGNSIPQKSRQRDVCRVRVCARVCLYIWIFATSSQCHFVLLTLMLHCCLLAFWFFVRIVDFLHILPIMSIALFSGILWKILTCK